MKKLLTAAAVVVGMAGPALAADLPAYVPPAAAVVTPVYNWTGLYVGLSGGYVWGRSQYDFIDAGTFSERYNVNGGIIGGTLGYNWQVNQFVFGVEGDISWTSANGDGLCANPAFACETKLPWLGTVRARAGVAFDNVLLYATGGLAVGEIKARDFNIATGVIFGEDRDTRVGWTVGAGVEWAINYNWSVKAEYLYVDLGELKSPAGILAPGRTNVDLTSHVARIGVNYRF